MKRYPIGTFVFIFLSFISTLFPPYKQDFISPYLRTINNEKLINGSIERRGFIFGNSITTIQIGWGWEEPEEALTCQATRKAFFDSIVARYEASSARTWWRWQGEIVNSGKYHFDFGHEVFSPPKGWLDALRDKFHQFEDVSDSTICRYVEGVFFDMPSRSDAVGYYNWKQSSFSYFCNKMDSASSRANLLLLYSELGLVSNESLDVLNTRLAPPPQTYYSTREYADVHRELNLAELVVDYLIALFLATTLEATRLLLSLFRRKVAGKKT